MCDLNIFRNLFLVMLGKNTNREEPNNQTRTVFEIQPYKKLHNNQRNWHRGCYPFLPLTLSLSIQPFGNSIGKMFEPFHRMVT